MPGYRCGTDDSCFTECTNKESNPRFELPDNNRGNPGYILAEMKNGIAPFEYHWTVSKPIGKDNNTRNGTQRFGAPEVISGVGNMVTNLEPGIYCYTIYDAKCCEVEECIEVNCGFDMEVDVIEASCGSDISLGSISLTSIDGVQPITYLWSNGETTKDLEELYAGVYSVVAIDADSCFFMQTITVNEINTTTVTETISQPSVCADDGAIHLTVTGKGDTFTYLWSTGETEQNLVDIFAGEYCVTVTDNNDCKEVECFMVEALPPMEADLSIKHACGNNNDGQIEITVSGGNPPYSYWWQTGQTGSAATDLAPGAYIIIISDADGCELWKSAVIQSTPSLRVYSTFDIPCSGQGLTASVNVLGGTPPYTYLWNNGSQSTNIKNVPPGFYHVDITDANGCTVFADFDLNYTGEILLNPTIEPQLIGCDNSSGSIQFYPTGGKNPYTYYINGPNIEYETTSSLFENLDAGTYFIRCADACGNETEAYIEVNSEVYEYPFSVELTATPSCSGSSTYGNGSIDVDLTYSGNEYSYLWSNGSQASNQNNLVSDIYTVTVTDSNGCEQHASVEVPENPGFAFGISSTNSCGEVANGSAEVTIENAEEYEFLWSTGETTQAISGLSGWPSSSGQYFVSVTNLQGCIQTISFIIGDQQPLDYEVEFVKHFTGPGSVAQVNIISDQYESGGDMINLTTGLYAYPLSSQPNAIPIFIPFENKDDYPFKFKYIHPNGCEYVGQFGAIPSCVFPEDGFEFEVSHQDSLIFLPSGAILTTIPCAEDQKNRFLVTPISSSGTNYPYTINVRMIRAAYWSERNYTQKIVRYNSDPFYIEGVPDGEVEFYSTNNCTNDVYHKVSIETCCSEFSCDIMSEGIITSSPHGYEYNYPFVEIRVIRQCMNNGGKCGPWQEPLEDDCSGVAVFIGDHRPMTCFDGTVTITSPEGSTAVIDVDEGNFIGELDVSWIQQMDEFEPDGPGMYTYRIDYRERYGDIICSQIVDVEFYGETNGGNHWQYALNFETGYGQNSSGFFNNYGRVHGCPMCNNWGNDLYLEDSETSCDEFNQISSVSFTFVPNEYYSPDPCATGGVLTYLDFDGNGGIIEKNHLYTT